MITDQDFKESLLQDLINLLVIMNIKECPITDKYSIFILSSDKLQMKSSCGPLKTPIAITPIELINSTDYNIFKVIIASIRKHIVLEN